MAASSDVFKITLVQDLTETQRGQCIITDISAATLEVVVEFIYGFLMEERARRDPESVYRAADKYQMKQLQVLCAKALFSSLTMENAESRYLFSHSYEDLKDDGLKIIL